MGNFFVKCFICGYPAHEGYSHADKLTIDNLPPEALDQILQHVDSPELYKCRLVCSHWSRISTGILKIRKELRLTLKFNLGRAIQLLAGTRLTKLNAEAATITVMHRRYHGDDPFSRPFPFTQLTLSTASFESLDAAQFFAPYGSYIKSLYLLFEDPFTSSNSHTNTDAVIQIDMNKLFTSLAPKIHNLRVKVPFSSPSSSNYSPIIFPQEASGSTSSSSSSSQVNPNVTIPNLRFLFMNLSSYVPGHDRLLQQILAAAPNLAIFETSHPDIYPTKFLSFDYLPTFADYGKISLIQRAELVVCRTLSLPSVADTDIVLQQQQCQVRSLKISPQLDPHCSDDRVEVFYRILKASSHCLEHIDFTADPTPLFYKGTSKNVRLTLPTVKQLRIRVYDNYFNYSWMAGFDFSRLLPALSIIYLQVDAIDLTELQGGNYDWPFPRFGRPVHSVQQLTICMHDQLLASGRSPARWMETLSLNFPRVKKLEILKLSHALMGPLAGPLWTFFLGIHHLVLEIILGESHCPSHLDSFFSGFSLAACWKFRDANVLESEREEKAAIMEIENIWRNPSILKMKDLVKLDVTMRGTILSVSTMLSYIPTGKLTFQRMPGLAVTISIADVRAHSMEEEEQLNSALMSSMGPFAQVKFCSFSRRYCQCYHCQSRHLCNRELVPLAHDYLCTDSDGRSSER